MSSGILIRWTLLIVSVVLFTLGNLGTGRADERTVHQLVADAVNQFNLVEDYTCRLDKTVRKGSVVYSDRNISVKYKKPAHYYFRWNSGNARGREVIFVHGKYNDKLVAHPGGIFKQMTLRLDPEGYLAMRANRHSLKNSGMEKIIALISSNVALARSKGLDVIHYIGEERFDGIPVTVVEGRFPEEEGFYAHRIRLSFCPTVKLPLKVSIYNGSEELVEAYEFHDLKINVGLSDDDFDPHNPQYGYRHAGG